MARVLAVVLPIIEIAAAAMVGLALSMTAWSPNSRHVLNVLGVSFAVVAMAATFSGARGIVRRLHDAWFENEMVESVRYFFLMRYHFLCAALMIVFPALAVQRFRRLLEPMFDVRPLDMLFVSWMALLNAWAIMVGVQLTSRYGPHRFGGGGVVLREAWRKLGIRLKVPLFGVLAVPMIATCLWKMERWGSGAAAATGGAALAFLTLGFTTWQRESLVPPQVAPSRLLLNGNWFRRTKSDESEETDAESGDAGLVLPALLRFLGPGYYDVERARSRPGHLLAASLLAAVAVTYGLIGFTFRPRGGWNDWFPPLGYALIIFLLGAWGLPAAAFFFDRWRVPVLGALLSTIVVLYSLSNTDHYYPTKPADADLVARAVSLTPQEAFDAWHAARPGHGDRMTVVVLSGGGISAAAWAAEVLTGLESAIGRPFTESLHALSSASGGSVGAMYYLDGFGPRSPRPADELERIRSAARRSSLAALAWGVAYPDAWRFVAPPIMRLFPDLDRGWALQEAWRGQLARPGESLFSIRARIARGEMPVPLFDATMVDAGKQFVMCPADIHRAGGHHFRPSLGFLREFDGRDLDLVTAARLSATFPWVSPIPRASRASGGPDWHIADGAYFDNYGVVSMVEWLNVVLPRLRERAARPRVLIIRVSIRDVALDARTGSSDKPGWTYTLYGPVITLLSTSSTSQLARNEQLLELISDRWTSRDEIDFEIVHFALNTEVPLSWQLTADAIAQIQSRWETERAEGAEFRRVQEFFRP
ncbi:MAG: patatin-like phospholipase family protein [Planctomycetes bacterium]|nr:patatin-like phospholipase family protein [Planctomycetota bacterium]